MTPQDRELARRAIEEGRLNVDQVTSIKEECDKSGRPFADVAAERGYKIVPRPAKASTQPAKAGAKAAAQPPKPTRTDIFILAGAVVVLAGILIISALRVNAEWGQDEAITEEMARFRAKADQLALEVRREYARGRVARRKAEEQAALDAAREALASVEERMAGGEADPGLYTRLTEAAVGFTRWIQGHPGDAGVRIERARAYELRKDYGKAIADLERAGKLDADAKPALSGKIQKLRILLARSFAPEK